MATIEKEKALDVVRQMVADGQVSQEVAEKYFPELKESEDERIRQLLLRFVEYDMPDNYSDDFSKEGCLVWLKKQGEQKSADKVEPKFKVGDRIRYKHDGYNRYKIEGVGADYYVNGFGQRMDMSYTDANFEIINKPAWSEGDETVLNNLIYALANDRIGKNRDEYVNWLKSLKEKYTWKPTKEQIMALRWVLNHIPYDSHKEEINGLLEQLIKLYNYGENR